MFTLLASFGEGEGVGRMGKLIGMLTFLLFRDFLAIYFDGKKRKKKRKET